MRTPTPINGEIIKILPHPHRHKHMLVVKLNQAIDFRYLKRPFGIENEYIDEHMDAGEVICIVIVRRPLNMKAGETITGEAWYKEEGNVCHIFREARLTTNQ